MKTRNRIFTQVNNYNNFNKPGVPIKERIKMFNGEFIKKKIYRNENLPGKVRIPSIFLPTNQKNNKDNKEKGKDIEKDKDNHLNNEKND